MRSLSRDLTPHAVKGKRTLFASVVMSLATLSACGGGDNGNTTPQPPPQPAPQPTFIYASNTEVNNISGYRVDSSTGALTSVSGSPFAAVDVPTGVAVHPTSNYLVAGIFSGSKLLSYRFDRTTGALTQVASLDYGPGAPFHMLFAGGGQFLYSTTTAASFEDISGFSFNSSTGALTALNGSPFGGSLARVQALAVNSTGTLLYAVGTGIAVYSIDGTTGALTEIAGSPFHQSIGDLGRSTALHGSDRFLYIADPFDTGRVRVFAVDTSGAVGAEIAGSPFSAGTDPSWITLNASGTQAFVANHRSGDVSAFSVNGSTGVLTPVGTVAAGSGSFSLTMADSGKFLYVANQFSGDVSAYAINPSTGALTPVAGSPFASGNGTIFVTATR